MRIKRQKYDSWETENELDFISNMGMGVYKKDPISRIELLVKYINAAKKRDIWCGMDKKEIINYAEGVLRSLTP
jgi:hypothetical protein